MKKYLTLVLAIGVFLIPFLLYLATLAPTYIPIDAAEFTLCVHFWGVCHPPGFPLYILVGKIFTSIFPVGSLIWRVNLMSAIFGAATILLVYLSMIVLRVRRETAFLLSLFLAVTSIFWEFSLSADVFSFSAFLIALSLFLVFSKRKYMAFFALGLSSSHFYLSAVMAPIFVWYLWSEKEENKYSIGDVNVLIHNFFIPVLLFFAGFFPQVVMYFRMQSNPPINWGHAKGIGEFINFVRRREFGSIFLIANPVLTFSLVKFYKHIIAYFVNLFTDFGAIVPVITLASLGFWEFLKQKKVIFLLLCFVIMVFIQLFLLSTIDPGGENNPFQLNKFYLTSFVIFVIWAGLAFDFLAKKLFGEDMTFIVLILSVLILIFTFSNYKTHDYSKNRFTENLVIDGLSMLPPNSLVITVDHPFYFGGLYEQKINGKFRNLTLVYFPNEKNRDSQNYHPEVFNRPEDTGFVKKIKEGKKLGAAEEYVLLTISKNLDRPIYILQGSFEENFFQYLKPYIEPYGLFWRVKRDDRVGTAEKGDRDKMVAAFDNLRNANIRKTDLELRQQAMESVTYAISYHSTAVLLGSAGDIDGAKMMFEKSLAVDDSVKSVRDELELLDKIKMLSSDRDKFVAEKNDSKLSELGNGYFSIEDYSDAAKIFELAITISSSNAQYFNNAASSYAYLGQKDKAENYYRRALELDPKMDLAKQGLENLGVVNGR